jgi:guanylate kinase
MKNEKILIVGKSGSGKDHLLRGLIKKSLSYSPKYTTRPKRNLETDGVEYNFISNFEFTKMIITDKMKFHQLFIIDGIDWYYGISKESFEENQVFIITPSELNILSQEDRKRSFVVYLDIEESVRRKRITKRDDTSDSVDRRIKTDEIDFNGFNDYDLKITDPDFEVDMVYDLMN